MTAKTKVITLISLTCLLAIIVVVLTHFALDFRSHLEGYIGYCSSVRLPAILGIVLGEIALTAVVCCVCIYAAQYTLPDALLTYALPALLLNAIFLAYHISQYPLLLKVSSIWNSHMTSQTVLKHPLLYVAIPYSLLLLLFAYQNKKGLDKRRVTAFCGIVVLLLLGELAMVWGAEYERCFG